MIVIGNAIREINRLRKERKTLLSKECQLFT